MNGIDDDVLERFRENVGATYEAARLYAEGAVLLASGDAAAAAARFEGALATGEVRFHLKVVHGFCAALLMLGRAAEAEPLARALLAERPGLLTPYLLVGRCLLLRDRPGEALSLYRRALSVDGGDPTDRSRIVADGAVALDCLGQYAQGESWCLQALASLPAPSSVVYLNLATFRFRLGKVEGAREALCMARTIAPDTASAVEATWADHGDGSPL